MTSPLSHSDRNGGQPFLPSRSALERRFPAYAGLGKGPWTRAEVPGKGSFGGKHVRFRRAFGVSKTPARVRADLFSPQYTTGGGIPARALVLANAPLPPRSFPVLVGTPAQPPTPRVHAVTIAESALTQICSITPLESALTKMASRKSRRISTYKNRGEGG
jgi:hypothetical protein